jgi:hypothetical protein
VPHVVTISHQTPRTRAECSCSWTSPWITQGPPQPDIPPRQNIQDKAIRAAQWHVQQAAQGVTPS